ncbi:MAG: fumarylacetoacetate hydrolase family protein [Pseudomonadota bacterium]
MDEEEAAARAAAILEQEPFTPIPGVADMHRAYRVQGAITQAMAEPLGGFGGYKIAWNTPQAMVESGLREPGFGRLFQGRLAPTGTVVERGSLTSPFAEPEFAAVLRADPGPTPDRDKLMETIDKFVPAIEILDRRGLTAPASSPDMVAQNIFNAGVVMGFRGVPPEDLPPDITTRVTLDGVPAHEGSAGPPQDPFDAVAWLCRMAHVLDVPTKAGDVLLLGSHTPLLAVEWGQEMVVEMAGLGEVRCQFEG